MYMEGSSRKRWKWRQTIIKDDDGDIGTIFCPPLFAYNFTIVCTKGKPIIQKRKILRQSKRHSPQAVKESNELSSHVFSSFGQLLLFIVHLLDHIQYLD